MTEEFRVGVGGGGGGGGGLGDNNHAGKKGGGFSFTFPMGEKQTLVV